QKGQESRRRFQVYAGSVFLTEVGARFDEQRQVTEVTARDIAPAESAGRVELSVFAVEGADNKRGKKVFTSDQKGAPRALTFTWTGSGSEGKPQPRGRYLAELVLRDGKGKTLHSQSTLFFHDSEAAQRASFGEVEGRLSLQGGGGTGTAANTVVELVDEKGKV